MVLFWQDHVRNVAVGKCRWMLGARVEHSVFDEYRLTTLQAAWLYGTNWWLLAENWCKRNITFGEQT